MRTRRRALVVSARPDGQAEGSAREAAARTWAVQRPETPKPARSGLFAHIITKRPRGASEPQPKSRPRFRLDFATDLTRDFGSARWFRGLGVMLALIGIAWLCRPGFAPVEAAPATRFDAATRSELRETAIMPLALGADTGSRMGPAPMVTPIAAMPERPRIRLVTTLNGQDSFTDMLSRAGVGAGDAARAAGLIAAAVPLDTITPGTRIAMVLGPRPPAPMAQQASAQAARAPRPLEHLDLRARFDLALAIDRRGANLTLSQHAIPVDAMPLRIRGTVGESLARSAYAAGAPIKAIHEYLQVLNAHIGLDSLSPSDTYDLILDYKRAADGESEAGGLLYAGLEHGSQRLRLLRWGADTGGNGNAFLNIDNAGNRPAGPAPGRFVMPIANGRLTSAYGLRFHPILGYTRMHQGVDLAAAWGTPIHAMADGIVTYAGVHGGHGNFVRLDHGAGLGTGYAHMSQIAVTPGERVRTGQVIGYVGTSGLSTGPHLHYEVYRDGRTTDPMSIRFAGATGISAEDISLARARLARLLLVRPGAALAPLKLDATDR